MKKLRLKIPEGAVKSACIKLLKTWGLHPIRNTTGVFSKSYQNVSGGISRRWIHSGLEGSGDLLVCTKSGRWCEIETKASNGKQREVQKERQQYVESIGGIYIVAHSLDDLIARQKDIIGEAAGW